MFATQPNAEPDLNAPINELLKAMENADEGSDEYTTMVDQLVKLYSLKADNRPKRVSPDTLALIAGNLAGILLIVGHERANVVTSKALSFVMKAK